MRELSSGKTGTIKEDFKKVLKSKLELHILGSGLFLCLCWANCKNQEQAFRKGFYKPDMAAIPKWTSLVEKRKRASVQVLCKSTKSQHAVFEVILSTVIQMFMQSWEKCKIIKMTSWCFCKIRSHFFNQLSIYLFIRSCFPKEFKADYTFKTVKLMKLNI